ARIGRGWQQAGTNGACVRSWTAPREGTVRVIGRAIKEYYRRGQGEPLRVRIRHGAEQVWPDQGWAVVALNDLQGCGHDLEVRVKKGDLIRFELGPGSQPEQDIIAWMPRIVYEGEVNTGPEAGQVRILCGAQAAYRDRGGNEWGPDRYYAGGEAMSTGEAIELNGLSSPGDEALYQRGRQGKAFTYTIPLGPGLYTVRLKWAEPEYDWSFERPFNVSINGQVVAPDMDVCQAARGSRRAYDRVFHYVAPDGEGNLVLGFSGGYEPLQKSGQAMVQAIEVMPELKPVVRIDCGSGREFIDWNSYVWGADRYYEGGESVESSEAVSQASPTLYDQGLYQSGRRGRLISYSVPVGPGLYTVHLKFAELWLKQTGQRPMTITINGQTLWKAWDPATAANQLGMAADIRAQDIAPDQYGRINIRIAADGSNDAILQGIEIE
ncbi:MAG: malectin, partial [Candidatus Omnitrophica bacterium]|nr:malectin [Candidatus Omnitrophota bacterium]